MTDTPAKSGLEQLRELCNGIAALEREQAALKPATMPVRSSTIICEVCGGKGVSFDVWDGKGGKVSLLCRIGLHNWYWHYGSDRKEPHPNEHMAAHGVEITTAIYYCNQCGVERRCKYVGFKII